MNPELLALALRVIAEAVPKLIELFAKLGDRDAFLAALDSALIVARAKNDADLDAKHRAP